MKKLNELRRKLSILTGVSAEEQKHSEMFDELVRQGIATYEDDEQSIENRTREEINTVVKFAVENLNYNLNEALTADYIDLFEALIFWIEDREER